MRRELAPPLTAFAATGEAYLQAFGEALRREMPPPAQGPTGEQVDELGKALRRLRDRGATRPLESHKAERVFALAFAVPERNRSLDEIADLFRGPSSQA